MSMTARLRLPEKLDVQGLLVGWSMEQKHARRPIGFTFGDPDKTPETGYIDPIVMTSEGHLITLAPTGAGKGVGCIIPALLRHTGPVIVVDPKGENAAVTARRRRDMGQDVIILDPMGVTGEQGAQLNPLDLIKPDSAIGVDDAAALAGALLPKEFSGERNQYWWSRAQHLLIAVILHVATDFPAAERRLSKVREVLNGMAAAPEKYAESMMHSRHPEVRLIHGNLVIGARETLGSIISFAQEGVDFIRGPMVQQVSDKSSFSIEAVTRGQPLSIYLVLPPHWP